jgi:CBS-domain-containing membrane protein
MKVSEWLTEHPDMIVTVPADTTLAATLARLLEESCLRDVYVTGSDGRIVGHISHRRIAEHVLAEHRRAHTRRQLMERVAEGTAADFMNSAFATASPDEELDNVLSRQLEMELEDMPVVDRDGSIAGAINLTHVLRHYMVENDGEESG